MVAGSGWVERPGFATGPLSCFRETADRKDEFHESHESLCRKSPDIGDSWNSSLRGSAGWPAQLAPADDMAMEVRHRFACVWPIVENKPEAGLGQSQLVSNFGSL